LASHPPTGTCRHAPQLRPPQAQGASLSSGLPDFSTEELFMNIPAAAFTAFDPSFAILLDAASSKLPANLQGAALQNIGTALWGKSNAGSIASSAGFAGSCGSPPLWSNFAADFRISQTIPFGGEN